MGLDGRYKNRFPPFDLTKSVQPTSVETLGPVLSNSSLRANTLIYRTMYSDLVIHPRPLGYPFGSHGGLMPRPAWDEPGMLSPHWDLDLYRSSRCCDFCDAWGAIPDVHEMLQELAMWDPYNHAHITQMYETIHGHYMLGYDLDGPESYYMSREVEKLSKMMQKVFRRNPWGRRGFGDIGKYMGRGLQMNPRRRRYHVFPQPRYYDGGYYFGDRWGRGRY